MRQAIPDHPAPVSLLVSAKFATASPTVVHHYIYAPELSLISETDDIATSSPTLAYDYVWFGGQPIASVDLPTNTTHWTFTDHLGTPVIQTNAAGTPDWRADYEPYGRVYSLRAGASRHQPLRLPGQEFDDLAQERQYNIFRWYRGSWGRYTQPDPIGIALVAERRFPISVSKLIENQIESIYLPSRQHSFAYAALNPLDHEDKLGLFINIDIPCARAQADPAAQRARLYAGTPSFPGGKKGLHNGPGDAIRHCLWSCLMVEKCGAFPAWAAGTGHEIYGNGGWFSNPSDETAMDLYNNQKGRDCAGDKCGCDTCCLRKLFSQDLQDHP